MDNVKMNDDDGGAKTISIVDCRQTAEADDLKTQDPNNNASRWTRKRRYIIVSLLLLVLLICILTAAIVLFSLWTTQIHLQEKKQFVIGDKQVEMELYQDAIDSLTYYHITANGMEIWFILDVNRELEIMKVKKPDDSYTCYVSPRDSSKTVEKNMTAIDPGQNTTMNTYLGNETLANTSLPVVLLRPSTRAIKEKSILGRRGQELCQGIDTFWILSPCDSPAPNSYQGDGSSRVRRATYTYYTCYVDWNTCGPITFPDTPYVSYYRCSYNCGWQTYQF